MGVHRIPPPSIPHDDVNNNTTTQQFQQLITIDYKLQPHRQFVPRPSSYKSLTQLGCFYGNWNIPVLGWLLPLPAKNLGRFRQKRPFGAWQQPEASTALSEQKCGRQSHREEHIGAQEWEQKKLLRSEPANLQVALWFQVTLEAEVCGNQALSPKQPTID
ncbi:predicted protein [Histoplasma capsulatum var. duboisii H88]|uniref:Predicted protein n=1 Tax=Ajellomyces capsulatus (strain H88) TaxID=544711 RepID=F0UMD1_AJEC8|nr:predicted protein [Histoplasma capsulatum var. duboisii H88]